MTSKIIIESSIIAEMINYDLKYPERETAGLLLGRHFNGIVYAEEISIGEQEGNAIHVEISEQALIDAVVQVSERADKMTIIGWWHSHPNLSSFMSGTDIATQSRYQNLFASAIAIVIDPVKYSKTLKIADLDYGVYRLVNGQPNKLPFRIVSKYGQTKANGLELYSKVTQKQNLEPIKYDNLQSKVSQKIVSTYDLRYLKENIPLIAGQLPKTELNAIKAFVNIHSLVHASENKLVSSDVSNQFGTVENSMNSLSRKLQELIDIQRDSIAQKTLTLVLAILLATTLAFIFVSLLL